jgi:hypothetical protein
MSGAMTSTIAAHKLHIIPFFASLLICAFPCNLSADSPQIRVSVAVGGDDTTDTAMLSALSHEFRKLDGVSVTDNQPALKIHCVVYQIHGVAQQSRGRGVGYAASVAIMWPDGRLATHIVCTSSTVDALAHMIAVNLDGSIIEQMRRAAQPSSSP